MGASSDCICSSVIGLTGNPGLITVTLSSVTTTWHFAPAVRVVSVDDRVDNGFAHHLEERVKQRSRSSACDRSIGSGSLACSHPMTSFGTNTCVAVEVSHLLPVIGEVDRAKHSRHGKRRSRLYSEEQKSKSRGHDLTGSGLGQEAEAQQPACDMRFRLRRSCAISRYRSSFQLAIDRQGSYRVQLRLQFGQPFGARRSD